jgi:hypothetical protein
VIFRTWWRDLCVFGMCVMKSPDNEPEAMTGLANELCHSGSDTGRRRAYLPLTSSSLPGRAGWWLPRWLDRLLPDVRFGH